MKISEIINESAKSDMNLIAMAKSAWDNVTQQIIAILTERGLSDFDPFEKSFDDLMAFIIAKPLSISFGNRDSRVLFLPRQYDDTKKAGAALVTSTNDEGTLTDVRIQMYYVPDNTDMISINDFKKQLSDKYRSAFIHEFTHGFDLDRSNDEVRYTQSKRHKIKSGEYYDTPHEYNAFFSQVIEDVNELFPHGTNDITFKNFVSEIRINNPTLPVLTSELKAKKSPLYRSMIKRLHNIYQELKIS